MNDVGTLDTGICDGYIVRPKEVRVTCDTSQRIIKTFEPRESK